MNPKQMQNATKAVQAGMKILYAPQTRKLMQQSVKQSASGDPQALAVNVVGVVKLLFDQSKGTMPPDIIPIVTVMLIYEFASFVSEAAGEKIPEEQVKQAIKIAMDLLKKAFAEHIEMSKQGQAPQPPQAPAPQPQQPAGLINQGAM